MRNQRSHYFFSCCLILLSIFAMPIISPSASPIVTAKVNASTIVTAKTNQSGSEIIPNITSKNIQAPTFYPGDKKDCWFLSSMALALMLLSLLLLRNMHLRRRTERIICENEERLRFALGGSQDGFWDWDVATGENIVDEGWCQMLGYHPDEIEQTIQQWQRLVHPDDLPAITKSYQQCMVRNQSHFSNEFRMRTKNGSWKWILASGMVVSRNSDQQALRLTGTHRDISRQKTAEQALKKALRIAETDRNNIDAILKSIGDGLIVSDNEHRIILLNHAAEAFLRVDSQQAIGLDVTETVNECLFNDELTAVLKGNKDSASIDLEMFYPIMQETRIIQARFSPIYASDDQRSGVITTLQDVTRIREMARLKSEFISTAAHELRTPLTAIMGFADVLLDNDQLTPETRREYLQIIVDKTEGLSAIVDDLLDLSRIESGRIITLDKQQAKLSTSLQPLIDQYRNSCPKHQFITTIGEPDPWLLIDQNKITQVMENLLCNAVKYSPKGGCITIHTEKIAGNVQLTISDQGIGMTPAQLERIFDKFYRVDSTNTAVGGLGLGMSIVKNIIKAHAGTIQVKSTLGVGTRVHILLPITNCHTDNQ